MNDFRIFLPLTKTGDRLTGIASATSVDRDEERMSDEALSMMADDIKRENVNLFGNHSHEWENILGGIDEAIIIDKKLHIGINPNTSNPKYNQLIGTMNTKGVKVGLSVGGNVAGYKWEYDKNIGKKVKILDRVKIFEVSIVGIPSNADSFLTIPQAIAKSAKLPISQKQCKMCLSYIDDDSCGICNWRN